jgi:hypothetical protein
MMMTRPTTATRSDHKRCKLFLEVPDCCSRLNGIHSFDFHSSPSEPFHMTASQTSLVIEQTSREGCSDERPATDRVATLSFLMLSSR